MQFSVFRKLAVILNLAFLTAMIMRFYPVGRETVWASLVIVAGLILSPVANLVALVQSLVMRRKTGWPADKVIFGIIITCFLVQVMLLFFTGWLSLNPTHDS